MDQPDGIPGLPPWSVGAALDVMDELGVASAILSISSPGVVLPTASQTKDLARAVNDAGADAVRDAPDRFGLFASLPLPDLDEALAELGRAMDELGADGVALMTNTGGRYLSDPAFGPLLEEMNRRRVIALMHPVSPPNHESVSLGRPTPMIEFPFETTRAVVDLVLSGAIARFPSIRWIIPHAGAALPVVASRVAVIAEIFKTEGAGVDVDAALRGFYYDLAGLPLPILLPALIALVGTDRLLYGSDTPFTPTPTVIALAARLAASDLLADTRGSVFRGTAEMLFPRLGHATGGTQEGRRFPSSVDCTGSTPTTK